MENKIVQQEKANYSNLFEESDKFVNLILQSKSSKKVLVAGPGTGKTFLFKKILENKKKNLTLTFVNSLVEDLSLDLCGMSEVKTLHSYARSILLKHTQKKINISPILSKIIKEDALILINHEINFNKIFQEIIEDNKSIEFYKKRKDYYGYYGYDDIIYTAVKYFSNNKNRIPTYDQILVDEFQDFNRLEVSLIDLLAEKSPILLSGDDDQALYEFKSASTQYIRERNDGKNSEYESFNLPYCFRCTRVVVDAANDIINTAKKYGYLSNRIEKPYLYLERELKNKDSNNFNKILYCHRYDSQIPYFIEKKIQEMAEHMQSNFSVLIISRFRKQTKCLVESLKDRGFQNIDVVIQDESDISILEGIKLLLEDKDDNLGWRIVSKFLLNGNDFTALLKSTESEPSKKLQEILCKNDSSQIKNILKVLKLFRNKKTITKRDIEDRKEDFDNMIAKLRIDFYKLVNEYLKPIVAAPKQYFSFPGARKILIKSTTVQSLKGLDADLVFITHFDDRYFISNKEKISDHDICNFVVAMTRTKKLLYLVSTVPEEPTFLKWINRERIEIIN